MTGLQVDIVVPVRNEERDLAPSVWRLVGYPVMSIGGFNGTGPISSPSS
jgi:hypothetical protein